MALKLSVEKLDDLEETIRPLYQEKDGKFLLDLEGYEDPAGLRQTIANQRRVEAERAKEIEKWKKVGKTPEEITEALTKLKELEDIGDPSKDMEAKIEAFKTQWLDKNQGKITRLEKDLETTRAERDKEKNDRDRDRLSAVIDRAIVAAKGKNGLRYIVERMVKIERDGNQTKFVVTEEDGSDRYNIGGPNDGKLMTITELLADLAQNEDYAGMFEGTGNSGGGGRPPAGGGKTPPLGIRKKSDAGKGIEAATKMAKFIDSYPTQAEGKKAWDNLPD